jgi:hypothetical protein
MNSRLQILALWITMASGFATDTEIARVPNPGRWTVRLLEKPTPSESAPAERFEVSREIWVLGTNRYEVTTWSDGKQGQLFINNNIGFEKSSTSNDVYVLDPNIGAPAPPAVAEWREMLWLKPELITGKTKFEKKDCVVYEEQTEAGPRRALIDAETRMPVGLTIKGQTYVYEFQKTPEKLPGIDAVIGGARQGYEAASKKISVDLKPR